MDVIEICPVLTTDTAFAKSINLNGVTKFSLAIGSVLIIDGNQNATHTLIVDNCIFTNHGKIIIQGAISDGIKVDGNAQMTTYEEGEIHVIDFANNANGQAVEIETGSFFGNRGITKIRGGGSNTEDGIVNDGSMTNFEDGQLTIDDIRGNSQSFGIENYGAIINRGTLVIDSIETASGIQTSGAMGSLRNDGSITTTNILNLAKSGIDILNGAKLDGEGVFNCHLTFIGSNNSIIGPGTLLGAMEINGDLYLDDESRFQIEIAGDNGPGSNNGHDQLVLNGDLTMENVASDKPTLEVILVGGFFPALNKNYGFIKHLGSLSGEFSNTVDKPAGLTGWSWWTQIPNQITFRRYCGGTTILENCGNPSCTLWSGYFDADTQIQFSGPFEIPLGEQVIFQSQDMELLNGFSVELGAVFEMRPGPCGT